MITASLVLYHNSIQDVNTLLNCVLESIIEKLYIIDNSRNDAFRILEQRSPKIRYIHSENVGYGSAHNIAMREAMTQKSSYHVILNPEIIFDPTIIESLSQYMNTHKDVGHIMPKVFYPNGDLQFLCKLIPTPLDLIFKRFLPNYITNRRLYKFQLRFADYDQPMNVPYLSGCFMFLRMSVLEQIGLFDERFFMYPEDIDLTRRIHEKFKTLYYPKVSIIHAHAAASKNNLHMLKIHIFNMIKYFNKWGWFFDNKRKLTNKQTLKNLGYYD